MAYEIETQKMKNNIEKSVENAIRYADLFVSKNYLIDLNKNSIKKMEESERKFTHMSLVEITKVCYDPQENVQEKLQTVYTSLFNVQSSALLLIKSTEAGIRFFMGIQDEKQPILSREILKKSLTGNFPGIDLDVIYPDETEKIMTDSFPTEFDSKSIAAVSIVPGKRESESFVQGLEKFIDTMAGETYTALLVAKPVNQNLLEQKKRGYEKLYTSLSVFSEYNLAYGENNSHAVNESLSVGFSDAINEGISDTIGTNETNSVTKSKGRSGGHGYTFFGINSNHSRNKGKASTIAKSENLSHTKTAGRTHSETTNKTKGETDTESNSITLTTTQKNKSIQGILKKIDEQLERIKISESCGLFDMACYFSSSNKQITLTAANTFKALVSGEQTSVENSFVNLWDDSRLLWDKTSSRVCEYLRYGKHVQVEYRGILIGTDGEESLTEQIVTPASLVSGTELPLIMSPPLKSVNGVSVVVSSEFGRNVRYRTKNGKKNLPRNLVDVGAIYHMGSTWKQNRVKIDIDSLAGHCFITGTTGSGKSNTTYKLMEELIDNKIKFLVIEPAKGEYKFQFGKLPEINIFTTNNRYFEMLHLNPFEFSEEIHVAEHLQKLVQVFSACWPLYAAMPAILKEAFEKSYRYCGWDLHHSMHFENGNGMFPTFNTLLKMLPQIINASSYSADSKGDYIGSLVTRVNSLTNGLVGDIFCSGKSIPDEVLFEENTIIDLSRLQSNETVSLIMGVLIMKLNEYRMIQNLDSNSKLRHVTVLEEAHNILKKVSLEQNQESGNVQGASVEMIRKSIAEMRTYGEGFIIIDQSPDEVDVVAIRNTNTKFIMKLSDKDDFETVGRTIGLNDDQILEIGKLQQGVAVTYQTEWEEPVLTMIDPCGNDYKIEKLIENDSNAEKELLGKIISELIEQNEAGLFNLTWVNAILNKEKRVSATKKQIYQNLLTNFRRDVVKLTGRKKHLRYANLMYELSKCEDLFEIFKLDIPKIKKSSDMTSQMKSDIEHWAKQIKIGLDRYFELTSDEKKELLEYLILHKIILTDEHFYKTAMIVLYP